jgi:hypothetical protein
VFLNRMCDCVLTAHASNRISARVCLAPAADFDALQAATHRRVAACQGTAVGVASIIRGVTHACRLVDADDAVPADVGNPCGVVSPLRTVMSSIVLSCPFNAPVYISESMSLPETIDSPLIFATAKQIAAGDFRRRAVSTQFHRGFGVCAMYP